MGEKSVLKFNIGVGGLFKDMEVENMYLFITGQGSMAQRRVVQITNQAHASDI